MMHGQEAPSQHTIPTGSMLNGCHGNIRGSIPQQHDQRVPPIDMQHIPLSNDITNNIPNNYMDERLDIGVATGPAADIENSPAHSRQNEKVKNLQEDILDDLSMYLDPTGCGRKNWRCFASFKGVTCAKIDYLESKGDPTRAMLKLHQFNNCTVSEFKQLCIKYERIDVLEEVFEAFGY
jgi:hypothetical protein